MRNILLNTVRSNSSNYKKFVALVDDADYEKVNKHKWYIHRYGNTLYAHTEIDGKQVSMHKFLTGFKQADHIDMNGLNNQRNNLREATHSQNGANRKSYKNSSSKYKGVCWDKREGKWHAQIKNNGKMFHIGYFKSEINGAQAYNFMAEKLHGEFARYN